MRERISVSMTLVALLALFGCATYGKTKPMGQSLNIDMLKKDCRNYDVYWTGLSLMQAVAIVFDPKDDGRMVIFERDKWYKVEDEGFLSMLIGGMQSNVVFYPVLSQLLGPDDTLYGYIYTGYPHVVTKPVDHGALWVYNFPGRLEREDQE